MPTDVAVFRKLALSFPGAVESAHMGQPDFRLNNRIFATLAAQARGCGTLKLTLEQQAAFLADLPAVFEPVQGGWGRMGMTFVHLAEADEDTLHGALLTAYRNVEAKQAPTRRKRTAKAPREEL